MFNWLKIPNRYYIRRPEGFDASKLSWDELRAQLNDLNKMEFHYAASNVTEILKRVMDRIDDLEAQV